MSDFSMFSLFAAGLACLVPFTAAYTQPVGSQPSGNPIAQPGLNSIVPAGKPFTVTWEPTTPGTVTLVLLKGPATNAVPQYAIVENYDNNGTFVWTPKTDLVPTTDAQGYGIQLIVDSTGQYQYTTQFGISNPSYSSSAASSTSCSETSSWTAPASSSSAWKTKTGAKYTTEVVTSYTTYCPYATTLAMNNKTYTVTAPTTLTITDCPCTITKAKSSYAPIGTGTVKPGNLTAIPGPYTAPAVPSSANVVPTYGGASGSATASASTTKYTGAASTLTTSFAGLVLAAGAAVFAL